MQENDTIMCPLIDSEIEIGDCVVYTDVADKMLKESCIPEKFRENKNWREVCRKCEYHDR
jgi:hypothetical protein